MNDNSKLGQYKGCMAGLAMGDAAGFVIEHPLSKQMHPVSSFAVQMALFTAEGLVLSRIRNTPVVETLYQAYLRWMSTQDIADQQALIRLHGTCALIDGHLTTVKAMHHRRFVEKQLFAALSDGVMGTSHTPVNSLDSASCVVWCAPVGLVVDHDRVFETACDAAAITHGSSSAQTAAGCLALIIGYLSMGKDLACTLQKTVDELAEKSHARECIDTLFQVMDCHQRKVPFEEGVSGFRRLSRAHFALAAGVYCALLSKGNIAAAIQAAVQYSPDKSTTGGIAGAVMGALYGISHISDRIFTALELWDVIDGLAIDLFEVFEKGS